MIAAGWPELSPQIGSQHTRVPSEFVLPSFEEALRLLEDTGRPNFVHLAGFGILALPRLKAYATQNLGLGPMSLHTDSFYSFFIGR